MFEPQFYGGFVASFQKCMHTLLMGMNSHKNNWFQSWAIFFLFNMILQEVLKAKMIGQYDFMEEWE